MKSFIGKFAVKFIEMAGAGLASALCAYILGQVERAPVPTPMPAVVYISPANVDTALREDHSRSATVARTEAETILTATAKALRQPQAAALSGEERAKIDTAVADLKKAIPGTDYKQMRKKIDQLNQATQQLAEVMMNSAVNTVLQGKKLEDF